MKIGFWVGLICFISLALLGWYGLLVAWSWRLLLTALWFGVIGALATIEPGEWQRTGRPTWRSR